MGVAVGIPATHRSVDPRSRIRRRHHFDPTVLQRAVKEPVVRRPREAPSFPYFSARVCHPPLGQRLRHQHGAGASRPQDVSTTMIYTHVLNRGGRGVGSPLDGVGVL